MQSRRAVFKEWSDKLRETFGSCNNNNNNNNNNKWKGKAN